MRCGRWVAVAAAALSVTAAAFIGAAPASAGTENVSLVATSVRSYRYDPAQVKARAGDTLRIADRGPRLQSVTMTLEGTNQKCQAVSYGQTCILHLTGLAGHYQLTAADMLGDTFTPATVTVTASGRPARGPASSPTPHPTNGPSRGPAVAPAPSPTASRTSPPPTAFAVPTFAGMLPSGQATAGNGTPPAVAPTYLPTFPTPSTSPTPLAVVAGPRPPSRTTDRQLGLPAALAAVLLIGLGAGLLRVVRAGAVDDLRRWPGPWRSLTRTSG